MSLLGRIRCLADSYLRESPVWAEIVAEAEREARNADLTVFRARDLFELAGRVEQLAGQIERLADNLVAAREAA
jgi:hypothetical protein